MTGDKSTGDKAAADPATLIRHVRVLPKAPVTTLAKYDDMVRRQDKLSVTNTRPENSVVRTID